MNISTWFNSLLGRPKSVSAPIVTKPVESKGSGVTRSQETGLPEDSVVNDLNAFKSIVGKVTTKVSEKASPIVSGAGAKSKGIAVNLGGILASNLVRKLIRVSIIVVVLLIVVFFAFSFIKKIGQGNGSEVEIAATPTNPPYEPEKLSIYAEDPEILKLEEEVNVLEREFSSSSVKESTLNPPNLDFEIKF